MELLSDLMEADGLDLELESDTISDFGTLIQTHLKPGVDAARRSLDAAIAKTATKLRAWAMIHAHQARKLKRPTGIFDKILLDPTAATVQLARNLMGEDRFPADHKETKEEKELDDVLDSLKF